MSNENRRRTRNKEIDSADRLMKCTNCCMVEKVIQLAHIVRGASNSNKGNEHVVIVRPCQATRTSENKISCSWCENRSDDMTWVKSTSFNQNHVSLIFSTVAGGSNSHYNSFAWKKSRKMKTYPYTTGVSCDSGEINIFRTFNRER